MDHLIFQGKEAKRHHRSHPVLVADACDTCMPGSKHDPKLSSLLLCGNSFQPPGIHWWATFVLNLALPVAHGADTTAGLPGAARQLLSAAAHAASAGGSGRALSAAAGTSPSLQQWLVAAASSAAPPASLARQQQLAWGHGLAMRGLASSSLCSAEAGKSRKRCCALRRELPSRVILHCRG